MPDQTVPPGVWTELPGGVGAVLNETGNIATVTVEGGEISFGGPMRWRPADDQEADHEGWGEDV